ncbi:hypothetical protein LCGC14_2510270, partial [marine sediment metagenome]
LSPSASIITYVNAPHLFRQLYGLALVGWTTGSNIAVGNAKLPITPAMLPSLPKLIKYVSPEIQAVSSDAQGITIESFGSLPDGGLSLISLPMQLLGVRAIPSLGRARSKARRAASAANLKTIGKACLTYAVENRTQFPPNLDALVEHKLITPRTLISPNRGRPRPPVTGTKPARPSDYIYLGPMLTSQSPVDLIVAYEKPDIHGMAGTNVLYVDGRVLWTPMAKLNRQLKRTRDYLAKQGK